MSFYQAKKFFLVFLCYYKNKILLKNRAIFTSSKIFKGVKKID